MTHDERQQPADLQRRIELLEATVTRLQAPKSRARRVSSLLSYVLVPPLALAGWEMAQQAPAPAPGMAPPPGPPGAGQPGDVIRKVDGITQVRTPFQVIDASGKVVLSVSNDDDTKAGVAIYVGDGAGVLSVHSGTATTVTELGTDENGIGILRALDAKGNLRAGLSGEGTVAVFDQSGQKRVAEFGTNEHGAGRLSLSTKSGKLGLEAVAGTASDGGLLKAMNSNGHPAAELRVAASGSGRVVVHNSGGDAVAMLEASASGKGVVGIHEKGRPVASVEVGDSGGGELNLWNAQGTGGLEADGSDPDSGGGRLVVFSKSGDGVAEIGTAADGKGVIAVSKGGEEFAAVLTTNDAGAGNLKLQNAQGGDGVMATGSEGSFGGAVMVLNSAGEDVAGIGAGEDGKGRVVVAEKDKQVAVLKAEANGAGALVLTNAQGKAGIEATGQDEDAPGASVSVFNKTGDDVVSLAVDDRDGGVVALHGQDKASAELSADRLDLFDGTEPILSLESDPGQLRVFDPQGEAVKVGLDAQGAGEVIISRQGKQVVSLEATPGGEGEVDVYGLNSSKPVAALRSRRGTGLVAVTNAGGEVVSEMGVFNDRGQVVVWNPGGKVPAVVMALSTDNGGGIVEVSNPKTGVASLSVSSMGAGLLHLTDSSGRPTVQAGTMPNGNGRVQAGPNFKCAPGGAVMALALLDCIVGRQ